MAWSTATCLFAVCVVLVLVSRSLAEESCRNENGITKWCPQYCCTDSGYPSDDDDRRFCCSDCTKSVNFAACINDKDIENLVSSGMNIIYTVVIVIAVAIVLSIVGGIVACCVCGCCCFRRNRSQAGMVHQPVPQQPAPAGSYPTTNVAVPGQGPPPPNAPSAPMMMYPPAGGQVQGVNYAPPPYPGGGGGYQPMNVA